MIGEVIMSKFHSFCSCSLLILPYKAFLWLRFGDAIAQNSFCARFLTRSVACLIISLDFSPPLCLDVQHSTGLLTSLAPKLLTPLMFLCV